jgi:hypothetical protein
MNPRPLTPDPKPQTLSPKPYPLNFKPQTLNPKPSSEGSDAGGGLHDRVYLTQSVFTVALQKSIPTQIRQLILRISNSNGQVDDFCGGVDFLKPIDKYIESDKSGCRATGEQLKRVDLEIGSSQGQKLACLFRVRSATD